MNSKSAKLGSLELQADKPVRLGDSLFGYLRVETLQFDLSDIWRVTDGSFGPQGERMQRGCASGEG